MKLVIPMAGEGSRFKQAGYEDPKPFIDVNGKPMIQLVLENLKYHLYDDIILLIRKEHVKFLHKIISDLDIKNLSFVIVDKLTEGAACTLLHAYDHLNTDDEIIIANSDQYIDFDIKNFLYETRGTDGGIVCFQPPDKNPKWSYAKHHYDFSIKKNIVSEVAEKNPISDMATVGIYYFSSGKKLLKAATEMIIRNIRTNNEFYICPIYNQYIRNNNKVIAYIIKHEYMHGLGTPEDLKLFSER